MSRPPVNINFFKKHFSALTNPDLSFKSLNIITYICEFFYRLQSGTTLQTAPPRNDLDPCHTAGAADGANTRLEDWEFRSFDCIVFEDGVFEAVHQLTVDLNVLVNG